jgi:hypothetical protein
VAIRTSIFGHSNFLLITVTLLLLAEEMGFIECAKQGDKIISL